MHSSGNQSLANTYVTKYIFSFQQHALYPFDFNIFGNATDTYTDYSVIDVNTYIHDRMCRFLLFFRRPLVFL